MDKKLNFTKQTKTQNSFYKFCSIIYLGLILFACTNLDYQALQNRVDDNFSNSISDTTNLDPTGSNQFSFAVMGDVHVGSQRGDILDQAVQMSKNAGDSFIVFTGDLTNNGESGEFAEFKEILNTHSMPFRTAIGNHDIMFNGWKHFKEKLGKSIFTFSADNTQFFILDSGNASLGKKQYEWVEEQLQYSTATHKIVISHYPPWIGKFSNIFKMDSEEEAAYFKNLMHKYQVSYMFSGHFHGYEKTKLGFTNYIVTGGVNRKLDPNEDSHFVRVTINNNQISTSYIEIE